MDLYIKDLSKKMKKQTILSQLSLHITGIYGLLGPNGAGKTTVMKIIAGLSKMDDGEVFLNEELISRGTYVKRVGSIGYLPQDFQFYPQLTIFEVLEHIAVLQGIVDPSLIAKEIDEVLEVVNLSEQRHKKIHELSGGMRRRVGIAQLLLRKPSILIFDEPTAGLDIEERIRFRNLLKVLGGNHTIIISSHIVEDIEFLCTKIGVIRKGKKLFEGAPDALKNYARHKTFDLLISKEDLDDFILKHEVVYLEEQEEKIRVRILSEEDNIGKPVSPRLMDGYLALLQEDSL
ncbi:ATP-binding cassette domain-containing protein [Rummeliibacillus suwonensis]|uniref:ATP-binding cassette domain-containing protein n=1 Tax=Rummeliibacillus suwonensis TaxID=1306154 RepID=UPI0011B5E4B6|nr:ATP-binding cassette domain-containing protein [Rummeliibacillus suwonensis]